MADLTAAFHPPSHPLLEFLCQRCRKVYFEQSTPLELKSPPRSAFPLKQRISPTSTNLTTSLSSFHAASTPYYVSRYLLATRRTDRPRSARSALFKATIATSSCADSTPVAEHTQDTFTQYIWSRKTLQNEKVDHRRRVGRRVLRITLCQTYHDSGYSCEEMFTSNPYSKADHFQSAETSKSIWPEKLCR